MELSNPNYYINRELGWLEFNERVMEEAQDKSNKILERVKFLAICSSNLDEFFMVRVSGLMDLDIAKVSSKDPSLLTPKQQLSEISEKVHKMVSKQYNCFNRSILPTLQKENILIKKFEQLDKNQESFAKEYFEHIVYPILTPMAIDKSRPFPLVNNKHLHIIIELLEKKSSETLFAVVQVPTVINRVTKLPAENGVAEFILLEDVIIEYIGKLFGGYKVVDTSIFRITRNADLSIQEDEAEDLLLEIEKSIKKRRWGHPVRIEIEKGMSKVSRKFLESSLKVKSENVYEINGAIDLTYLMGFSLSLGYEKLRNEKLEPLQIPEFIDSDMFEVIKNKDVLVHHPYDSFDCVIRFIKEASKDPNVLAIKQTLYRVSGNSPIVSSLINAVENGKQVTVLVELKARFDEENNILWAKKLEKAGCHVVYGLVGLKTHCKMCLVVRQEDSGIRRYVHLGTGNYNDSTAKIYTDLGFFTSKETFGEDVSALFNVLTGYSKVTNWGKIAVAPKTLRQTFLSCIEGEILNASLGKEALIIAKMNSLVDVEIIQALYKASMAGVKIKLIVRGICCLKAGIENVSENITVVSVVDKFLEHSRIYYFENAGEPRIFLSSADLMPRNLDRRVEVAFPIDDRDLKERLFEILEITLSDTEKLRIQNPDGTYSKIDRRGREHVRSQDKFYEKALERLKEAESNLAVLNNIT